MSSVEWKKELQKLLDNGVNIMDVEDEFLNKYKVSPKEIWDYVFDEYKCKPPEQCKGCKFVNAIKSPCGKCARKITLKDYYEKEIN